MISKTVRVGKVWDQDAFRREDMLRMSPSARIALLVGIRNRAFPYEPLKRVAEKRRLT